MKYFRLVLIVVLSLLIGWVYGVFNSPFRAEPDKVDNDAKALQTATPIEDQTDPYIEYPSGFAIRQSIANDTVHVQMGGYEYDIPRRFISSGADPSCKSSGVLLMFDTISFDEMHKSNSVKLSPKHPMRLVNMLMFDAQHYDRGLKIDFNKYLEGAMEREEFMVLGEGQEKGVKSYGLITYLPISQNEKLNRDFFMEAVDEASHERIAIIRCRGYGFVKSPSCDHYFPIHNGIGSLNYRIEHLRHWKRWQKMFSEQMNIWQAGKILKPKPNCCERMNCILGGEEE